MIQKEENDRLEERIKSIETKCNFNFYNSILVQLKKVKSYKNWYWMKKSKKHMKKMNALKSM